MLYCTYFRKQKIHMCQRITSTIPVARWPFITDGITPIEAALTVQRNIHGGRPPVYTL